jgi:hypothetical protein
MITLSHNYNLKALYPWLAAQWHPSKNGKLTPDQVTPGSNKKVWWLCQKGHEWKALITSRTSGTGCPFCAGHKVSKGHNLLDVRPDIAAEWHPSKNGDLTPDQVTPGSGKKVWWLCDEGHEWQASIDKRRNGSSCPYCTGRRVTDDYNLLSVNPELARQWHPSKNGDLTPDQVMPCARAKVWWMCDKGHEWEMIIQSRSVGRGCPYCNSAVVNKENNLLRVYPELARQWHPTKNGDLTPDKVTPLSRKKVWWMCDKGHEWRDMIIARREGNACPYCYGIEAMDRYNLSAIYPEIAREWHPTKNGDLTPDAVPPYSAKKVWWKCSMGHEWKASIHNRSSGCNCPYCHGRYASQDYNLQQINPGLAREWHPTKNGKLTPKQVTPMSHKRVWWRCKKGHEWEAVIKYRGSGSGCPFCSGKKASKEYNLAVIKPELAAQWHPVKNGDLTPDNVTPGTDRKVWWLCSKGHEWQARIGNRSRGNGCPYCKDQR